MCWWEIEVKSCSASTKVFIMVSAFGSINTRCTLQKVSSRQLVPGVLPFLGVTTMLMAIRFTSGMFDDAEVPNITF